MPKFDIWVFHLVPQNLLGPRKVKYFIKFVIFAIFYYRNMCIMPKIDQRIPECPTEFPESLKKDI
jgi:hypothetical protein